MGAKLRFLSKIPKCFFAKNRKNPQMFFAKNWKNPQMFGIISFILRIPADTRSPISVTSAPSIGYTTIPRIRQSPIMHSRCVSKSKN